MLDFSSDASAKIGDLTIKLGDLFSGNKTNINVRPSPKNSTIGFANGQFGRR